MLPPRLALVASPFFRQCFGYNKSHFLSFFPTYHYFRKTGQILSLNDVLGNDSEMKKAVGENIKEQMRSQMAADSGITYFLDSETPEWDFTGLTGEEDFYFDSQGQLVIVFDEYEVAPGYMGAVEFTIPKSVTEN